MGRLQALAHAAQFAGQAGDAMGEGGQQGGRFGRAGEQGLQLGGC
ncbi:MAG: hypothetical protein QM795_11840 [Pseudoxanthomonas sp.]